MHLFFAIVAAGITLYLLRNWWERFQKQRQIRRAERLLYPRLAYNTRPVSRQNWSIPPKLLACSVISAWIIIAIMVLFS